MNKLSKEETLKALEELDKLFKQASKLWDNLVNSPNKDNSQIKAPSEEGLKALVEASNEMIRKTIEEGYEPDFVDLQEDHELNNNPNP